MTNAAQTLKQQLATLPIEDRAELAEFLLESLDEARDAELDRAWMMELDRRWRQIESGEEKGIPAEQVMREVRELLERKK